MSLAKPRMGSRVIENPVLHVVLYQPEIPANTGNIARLCGAVELPLHLIHPLGFHVDDRHLKRAGLDYWQEVDTRHHMDFESFLRYKNENGGGALIGFSTHAGEDYTRAEIRPGDWLLFGRESLISIRLCKQLTQTRHGLIAVTGGGTFDDIYQLDSP